MAYYTNASVFKRKEDGKLRIADEVSTASQADGAARWRPACCQTWLLCWKIVVDAVGCGRLHTQALGGCHADVEMSWLAAVALLCSCKQTSCPALQVRDIELLHILVAGCLSYREWLERRDMLVSIKLFSDS